MLHAFSPIHTVIARLGYVAFENTALNIRHLTKSYGKLIALNDVSLEVPAAQVTAILGPNGAGKTTMMEICEGLITADSGTVEILGLEPIRDAAEIRARVGVMVQDGGLPLAARPGELIAHVVAMYKNGMTAHDLMTLLDIHPFTNTAIRRLSGGQRQRVALALALAGDPQLVFLDEPTTGLDPAARRVVWSVISELKDRGITVVLTTHFMEEAQELADQVIIMDQGSVIARGTVADLLNGPSTAVSNQATLLGKLTPQILDELAQWAKSRELTLAPRTLEDVFLEITGKPLQN